MDVATLAQRTILTNDLSAIEPGPDGRVYLGSSTNNGIHCITARQLQHAERERVRPQQERRAAAAGGSQTIWARCPT